MYTPVELEPGQHSQYSDLYYGLNDNTVKIPSGSRNMSLLHNITKLALGTTQSPCWVYGGFLLQW